ncbi:calcium-binding protein [Ciceribacter sp. L1K22]|uniref:calcium-binding protein n=1 Tax=Ciceribacter sp. L1K22 TaxID=2820275 RepID=UPI001ABE7217|nr:calcium-binding protein [Ciceribacter sp. L1K22]MBO3759446.1 calcium-binding protein [Ciceribacter sp. L1K22]
MAKNYSDFLKALGDRESGGNYSAVNRYGYLGKYQMGELAMIDLGYYRRDGTSTNDWKSSYFTGKDGILSKADFLASPAVQEKAVKAYMVLQWRYMASVQQYEGQTVNGTKITLSGMLAGAHLVGAGSVAKYLKSGGDSASYDGNGVSVLNYVKLFAGYATPFSYDHDKAATLTGGKGVDLFDAGGGDDTLYGYGGNDTLKGGSGHDRLYGGTGNDLMNGGSGADRMEGGTGNDTYYVNHIGDVVIEASGAGTDTIRSSISLTLPANVEHLVLTGSKPLSATGNSLSNTLSGNAGDNLLKGQGGNDTLVGGAGADRLYGGSGADRFVFKALSDSTVASAGRDMIHDFSRSQGDKIDLSAIDASTRSSGNQAFSFIGEKSAFTGTAGELRYVNSGGDTFVYGDVDGDRKADFAIRIDADINLVKGDFIL